MIVYIKCETEHVVPRTGPAIGTDLGNGEKINKFKITQLNTHTFTQVTS